LPGWATIRDCCADAPPRRRHILLAFPVVLIIGSRFAYGRTRLHIIVMSPSYESLRAELDEIVERYRAHLPHDGSKVPLTREEAVRRIRKLGFTEGDAMRWLDQKPVRRP
jgi:hypothetical protein